jgi:hypothetical protein
VGGDLLGLKEGSRGYLVSHTDWPV